MNIRELRRMARLSQVEVAALTGICRVRLSFAECNYMTLKPEEESAIRKAIAEAVELNAASVRQALTPKETGGPEAVAV